MNIKSKIIGRLVMIGKRELKMYSHRPLFLFCMIIAPLFCLVFLTTLMSDGLPTKLPAAMVDEDDTHITHTITRKRLPRRPWRADSHASRFIPTSAIMCQETC